MSKLRVVTQRDLAENAGAIWNAFVHVIATTDYEDLAAVQRPAHLAFLYESEVQNGGHLQYFSNWGDARGEETIKSLNVLGASAQSRVLEQALSRWRSKARPTSADVKEFAACTLEAEFDDLDRAFHACPEPLIRVLMRHLTEHEGEFIVRE